MPNKLITSFGAGIQKGGLQAPVGGMEECFNLWSQAGYLQVMGATKALTQILTTVRAIGDTTASLTLSPQTLQNVSGRLLTKMGRTVWYMALTGVADELRPFPLIDHRAMSSNHNVMVSEIGGDWIVSTLGAVGVEGAYRWSGKAFMGDLTVMDGPQVTSTALNLLRYQLDLTPLYPGSSSCTLADVHPGWIMWIGKYTAGTETFDWLTSGRVKSIDPINNWVKVYVPNVDDALLNACNVFCLVEACPLGIPQLTHPVFATRNAVTTGDLADGTYRYIARYVSSSQGFAGLPCKAYLAYASTHVIDATHKTMDIMVDTNEIKPLPYYVDQIEVYRSKMGATEWGLWYSVHKQNLRIDDGAGYEQLASSLAMTDDGGRASVEDDWIDGEALPEDAYWLDAPPSTGVHGAVAFNDMLYTIDNIKPWRMLYSSRGNADAQPLVQFDVTDLNGLAMDAGSFFDFGGDDPIVAIVPERGAFSNSGLTGDNLLIFKKDFVWRLYGSDNSDFAVYPAFRMGCSRTITVRNIDGVVFFRGPDHIYAVDGGGIPRPISKPLYPNGKNRAGLSDWAKEFGHYLIYTEDNTSAVGFGPTYLFDLDTGIFLQIDPASNWAAKPGDESTLIGVKDDNTWFRYFSEVLNTTWRFKTVPLVLAEDGPTLSAVKKVTRIRMGFTNKTGQAQNVLIKVYADGYATAAASATKSVPYSASQPYQVIHWGLPSTDSPQGRMVQVEMGGTLVVPVITSSAKASSSNLVVITTAAAHQMNTGNVVLIAGHSVSALNASWTITKIDGTHYSLDGSTWASNGTEGTYSLADALFRIEWLDVEYTAGTPLTVDV